jgi:tetratricopeptide (TPR) repeat protein
MKSFIFSIGILWGLISLLMPFKLNKLTDQSNIKQYLLKKKLSVLACTPDRNDPDLLPDDAFTMVPLPGWGNYLWKIQSKSDSTQFYFNQGINMYYSFHIFEALASFKKASLLDTEAPMPYWGIALAYGPNINDVTYTATPKALEAIKKAESLSARSNAFEKGLITAMLLRYSADSSKKRIELDGAYAQSMKELYSRNLSNPDAGALYADALMLLHPWDLYDQQQRPKPWTPELVEVLENVLKLSPNHPAANHYYIHAVEASETPARALQSADKLGSLLPSVSHMVHMPSHIYIRTGMYRKGNEVNKKAIEGYNQYTALFPSAANGVFLYLFHNLHMQATCAIMNGDFSEAQSLSEKLKENIPYEYLSSPPPDAEYLQYMYMTEIFSYIRYGKWENILALPEIPDSVVYARILLEYGRGIAFARLGRTKEAEISLQKLNQVLQANERLNIKMGAFNTAYAGGEIAHAMLNGIIAEEKNNLDEAIHWFSEAVKLEDQLIYNEPRDWLLPTRQYLAAVYLKKGSLNEAEKILWEDLRINPDNGWALTGLGIALDKKGNKKEASTIKKSLDKLGNQKDFNKKSPVF